MRGNNGEENGNSYFGVQGLGIWRFPKNRGTFLGPQTKVIVFWVIQGNYHIVYNDPTAWQERGPTEPAAKLRW